MEMTSETDKEERKECTKKQEGKWRKERVI
jgi:hypothetical protein